MELNDIMALVKAGYTKDEIAQMDTQKPANTDPQPVPVPVPNNEPDNEPKPVQAQVNEPVAVAQPVAQPVQAQEPSQPTMADIMQGIAKLTSAVQANAIAQSVIPQGASNPVTAEDMLAEIIRPTYKPRE